MVVPKHEDLQRLKYHSLETRRIRLCHLRCDMSTAVCIQIIELACSHLRSSNEELSFGSTGKYPDLPEPVVLSCMARRNEEDSGVSENEYSIHDIFTFLNITYGGYFDPDGSDSDTSNGY
jgi:hypothetical protein